jgi:hypothetical protein
VKIETWFADFFFDSDGQSFPVKFVKEKKEYVSSWDLLLVAGVKPERVASVWQEVQDFLPDVQEIECELVNGHKHEDCLTLEQTATLLGNMCLPQELKLNLLRFILKSFGYDP